MQNCMLRQAYLHQQDNQACFLAKPPRFIKFYRINGISVLTAACMLCTNTNAWTCTQTFICETTHPSTWQRNSRCLLFFLLLNFLHFCIDSILRDLVENILLFSSPGLDFFQYSMAPKVWKNQCQPAFHCKDVVMS